jgi:putative exosortase-associated protein (TIGR04073 family)
MKFKGIIVGLLLVLAGPIASVYGENYEGRWLRSNDYEPNEFILAMDELGRGVLNTGLGVLEIPKQSIKRAVDTGHPYGYVAGLFDGIGFFVLRELAGVYEILTFPFPVLAGYAPVMDPLFGYFPEAHSNH